MFRIDQIGQSIETWIGYVDHPYVRFYGTKRKIGALRFGIREAIE